MICIYESTQTGVPTHNGLGALSPSKCVVAEDINGKLELSMEHPVDDEGKWERIIEERIIKAPTHRGYQLFRIYRPVKNPITGNISVNARHISYDLIYNMLEDVRPTVKTGQQAGDIILAGCQYATPFVFSSDIETVSTAYYIRTNPLKALIGNIDQAFIARWGGEIIRDNYSIAINSRIGANNGVRVAYGKNMTGLEATIDTSEVYTRIMPTALDADGNVFFTDAKYYDSPLIGNYPHPRISTFNTGIRVGREENGIIQYPDNDSAKTAMAAMAAAAFTAGADKPKVTVKAEFIRWKDTEEYKAYAALQDVSLGDDVTVYVQRMNIDVQLRAIAIEWDCILDRPNKITLGDKAPNIAKSVADNSINLSILKESTAKAVREGETYNNVTITHSDGVVTSATIDGVLIEVKQNAQDGFAIYADGAYIGGVKVIDGAAALISSMMTNSENAECYAVIGDIVDGGVTYRGIDVYNSTLPAGEPALRIIASPHYINDVLAGSLVRMVTYNGTQIWFGASDIYQLYVFDKNMKRRVAVNTIKSEFGSPNGNNFIGVDDTGAYKSIGGTRTNL